MTRFKVISAVLLGVVTNIGSPSAAAEVSILNLAWSPDGRHLAFEANPAGKFAIYAIASDGSVLRQLTSGTADDVQPAWSIDGRTMVFTSNRDGHDQLYSMRADGTAQHRLAVSQTHDFYASFSPDGSTVLFSAQDDRDRRIYQVGLMRKDGSARRLVTDRATSSEGPRWTVDGRHIRYDRVPLLDRLPGEGVKDFIARRDAATITMLMEPDGSSAVPLTHDDRAGDAIRDSSRSPDRRLQASGDRGEIVIADTDTGTVVRRLAGPGR
jgi:Tol biopolymer transport system component